MSRAPNLVPLDQARRQAEQAARAGMTVDDHSKARKRRNQPTGDWRDGLTKNQNGVPLKNMQNACIALRDHPVMQGTLAYDEFGDCTVVRRPVPWDTRPNRPWSEFDDLAATDWLQGVGVGVGSGIVREAVQLVAYETRFHPVLEWLETLEWDGVKRLDTWLSTYLGVPESALASAIGRKFLISAVARVQKPGCKVDHVLILEGQQGAWKSRTLRALVGDDWFTDQIADLGTKDSCQDLRGVWIVELSELSAIRPGEVEKVKAYLSRQVDHYRPSYGRRTIDVPRQCVFIGTTNTSEYLSDSTGNRRYWPVTTTKLDFDAIARDRGQLWAEAVAAFHAGEPWWFEDDELRRAAQQEQEQRRIPDPWEAVIVEWLDNPTTQPDQGGYRMPVPLDDGRVTSALILEHAIGKPVDRREKRDEMRVGAILRLLGWTKHHRRTGNWWSPPDEAVTTSDAAESQVVTPGVYAEARGNGHDQASVNTVNTCTSRASSVSQNHKSGGHGSHGVHTWPSAPPVGTIEDGYRYVGGDPGEASSWQAVQ
jgi:putative DNA primase/helicase